VIATDAVSRSPFLVSNRPQLRVIEQSWFTAAESPLT
jgi:hypothetical protein